MEIETNGAGEEEVELIQSHSDKVEKSDNPKLMNGASDLSNNQGQENSAL